MDGVVEASFSFLGRPGNAMAGGNNGPRLLAHWDPRQGDPCAMHYLSTSSPARQEQRGQVFSPRLQFQFMRSGRELLRQPWLWPGLGPLAPLPYLGSDQLSEV